MFLIKMEQQARGSLIPAASRTPPTAPTWNVKVPASTFIFPVVSLANRSNLYTMMDAEGWHNDWSSSCSKAQPWLHPFHLLWTGNPCVSLLSSLSGMMMWYLNISLSFRFCSSVSSSFILSCVLRFRRNKSNCVTLLSPCGLVTAIGSITTMPALRPASPYRITHAPFHLPHGFPTKMYFRVSCVLFSSSQTSLR